MTSCKPVSTPLEPGCHLHHDDSGAFNDIPQYRRLIGRLLYLTTIRPDICFATQQLSQFLSNPTNDHCQAAQRVFKYLKGSPSKGLFFSRDSSTVLSG